MLNQISPASIDLLEVSKLTEVPALQSVQSARGPRGPVTSGLAASVRSLQQYNETDS